MVEGDSRGCRSGELFSIFGIVGRIDFFAEASETDLRVESLAAMRGAV